MWFSISQSCSILIPTDLVIRVNRIEAIFDSACQFLEDKMAYGSSRTLFHCIYLVSFCILKLSL